jgi:hypothetical protein
MGGGLLMAEAREYAVIKVDKYGGLRLQEYNGKWSLVATQTGQNEVEYLKWVFLSSWSKAKGGPVPGEQKLPMGVTLGESKAAAIANLRAILAQLEGREHDKAPVGDDSCPF